MSLRPKSKLLRIGVDIDETLTSHYQAICWFHHSQGGKLINPEQITENRLEKLWGLSPEEVVEVYNAFRSHGGLRNLEPDPVAQVALQQLHPLVVITARGAASEPDTLSWLLEHFGDIFEAIHFTSHQSKLATARQERLAVMIEDSVEPALEMAEAGIPVVLLDRVWNQDLEHSLIARARNWDQVQELVRLQLKMPLAEPRPNPVGQRPHQ